MKELWIDGEYFIDPVDQAKREKALKIANLVVEQSYEVFKASAEGLPFVSILGLYEMHEVKRRIVQFAPLFPCGYSGEIVNVKGGIL